MHTDDIRGDSKHRAERMASYAWLPIIDKLKSGKEINTIELWDASRLAVLAVDLTEILKH